MLCRRFAIIALCALLGVSAWAQNVGRWSVSQEPMRVVEKMQVPESAVVDPATGFIYVSNIVGDGWADDHAGFITRLKPDGRIDVLKWRVATGQGRISAPKGLCILNNWLYATDNARVVRFKLKGGGGQTFKVPGAENLNDMATDGKSVWASDSKTGNLFCLSPDGKRQKMMASVPGLNGITFHEGRMYGVSWDLHDVYELDPEGVKPPRPFGLSAEFNALDGIEVLDDGTFLVSDFMGNKVCAITPDEKTVYTLVERRSAADIGVDPEGLRLFIPQFYAEQMAIYKLNKPVVP